MRINTVPSIFALVNAALAVAKHGLAMTVAMPLEEVFGLAKRQNGYYPTPRICGTGANCAEACSTRYERCTSTDGSLHFYRPSQQQICCGGAQGRMSSSAAHGSPFARPFLLPPTALTRLSSPLRRRLLLQRGRRRKDLLLSRGTPSHSPPLARCRLLRLSTASLTGTPQGLSVSDCAQYYGASGLQSQAPVTATSAAPPPASDAAPPALSSAAALPQTPGAHAARRDRRTHSHSARRQCHRRLTNGLSGDLYRRGGGAARWRAGCYWCIGAWAGGAHGLILSAAWAKVGSFVSR